MCCREGYDKDEVGIVSTLGVYPSSVAVVSKLPFNIHKVEYTDQQMPKSQED